VFLLFILGALVAMIYGGNISISQGWWKVGFTWRMKILLLAVVLALRAGLVARVVITKPGWEVLLAWGTHVLLLLVAGWMFEWSVSI